MTIHKTILNLDIHEFAQFRAAGDDPATYEPDGVDNGMQWIDEIARPVTLRRRVSGVWVPVSPAMLPIGESTLEVVADGTHEDYNLNDEILTIHNLEFDDNANAFSFGGFTIKSAPPTSNFLLILRNNRNRMMNLLHESLGSTASCRIVTPLETTLAVGGFHSIATLIYSGASQRWFVQSYITTPVV